MFEVGEQIYAGDPGAASDAEFVPGELAHAVIGNHARLLDARRTPLSVTDVITERGEFEVRIEAFEDRGALWRLPLWNIDRLQFDADAAQAPSEVIIRLRRAVERFDHELIVEVDAHALSQTRRRVADARHGARDFLRHLVGLIELDECIRRREGDERLYIALNRFLIDRDLVDLDRDFTRTMVSNPRSGELVKGHAIVLAELGLCPFRGRVIRDPALFAGDRSRARRAEHLIARMAFAQELWDMVIAEPLTLYRATAVDGPLRAGDLASFISCTFSAEVASAHFAGGPTTRTAAMWRQALEPTRLLMTFLETVAMNDRFKEAEAVLIADPDNLAF